MEEKKPLKIKFKTAIVIIILAVIVLGIFGANVYASVNGYGNVFFLIKYLVTGEKPEITGKNDLLSDRDITISYEPIILTEDIKLQIRNLQIKDNKAKLFVAVNESKQNETTPLKYKVYNESNKLICEQNSSKVNNETEYIEELLLNEFKNEDKILNLEIFNSKNEKLTKIAIDLETREIVIEGEKEAIEKISEIELKKYLSIIAGFEENFDVNDDDSRISLAIRINSIVNRNILYNGLFDATEINNILKNIGYGEISTNNYNGEFFREKAINGKKYFEMIYEPDTVNMETIIGEIKDITYSSNIYTVKFKYLNTSPKTNINYFDHEAEAKEATIYFKLNDDKTYSTFKVVKYVKGAEAINNKDTHIENDELIGNWEVSFAQENGKDISLMDIYGSFGPAGSMNFESNGRYTAFIGAYSSENEDDMQGDYINGKSAITLISKSGKKEILTLKIIDGIKYLEKEIGTTNRYVYFRKTSSNNFSEQTNLNNIVTQLTPSGFSGSSLHRIDLYSNKEVYLITFDGNGYEKNNIITKELIAKNVDSISKSEDGNIYIKGGTQVKDTFNWIHFEDSNIISNANSKNEYEKAVEAIKSKLLDKNWLKENTLIKSANGNSNSIEEQDYKFAVIKEQDTKNPVVVLVVTAEKILTKNTFVIRYKNNDVSIEKVSEGHYQHVDTLTNGEYYATTYTHMNEWAFELLEVSSNDIGVVDRNHGTIGDEDYDYMEVIDFENNNNLKYVTTELNESNLNKLLKN